MHDHPSPSPAEQDAQIDSAILMALLSKDSHRPWSVDKLAREMDCNPADSLRRLYGGGLIHRLDGFVWASRAAVLADELAL
jgi:hypothetical protein